MIVPFARVLRQHIEIQPVLSRMPAINRAVIAGLHNKLVQLYSGHARANHKKLADQFNTAAKEFAAAAAIVDPERDATAMVDEDEARRSAWRSAPPSRRATRCCRSGAAVSSRTRRHGHAR
jgi:hypothetical protein